MDKEIRLIKFEKIKTIVIIVAIVLVVCSIIFAKFAIDTQSRNMFREAKNVQLALDMLSVEYYARDMHIYDSNHRNGLADGVEERIEQLSGEDGDIYVTSYSFKSREVTGFMYERGIYRVRYEKNKDGSKEWTVDLIIPVFKYDKNYED